MESFTVTHRYSGCWIHVAVPLCLCAGKGTWRKEQIQHRAKKKKSEMAGWVQRWEKKSGKMWNIYNVIRSREVTGIKSIYVSWGGTRQLLWVYKNHSNGYIYVLFIVLLISFIFNFFYCYYIILERNILLFLRAEREKKAPQETKMAEECRRESR